MACPGASVELVSIQAGSVVASTIARYPEGSLPGGSLSPSELEQAAVSNPESLFSSGFLDEYGRVGPAMMFVAAEPQVDDDGENVTAAPPDGAAAAAVGSDTLMRVVVAAASAVLSAIAVAIGAFLFLRRLRGKKDALGKGISGYTSVSPVDVHQQVLMEISAEELQRALKGAQVLGKGGQAVVYRANLRKVHREPVAIKKLTGSSSSPVFAGDAAGAWSFVEEARRLHQLGSNPNIISIYAICPSQGALVMELGQDLQPSLHDCLARQPFLPWRTRLGFLYDIASALWHVHNHRMLHLDIKPANIIVKQDGKSALLADFGMADEVQESGAAVLGIEDSGQEHVGTKIYRDPFIDVMFRPASDIYSLGVTMVEVVTGQ